MRHVRLGWVLLLFLLSCGCARQQKEATGYRIYMANANRTRLETEYYAPQNTETKALLQELLSRMETPAAGTGNVTLFPEGVALLSTDFADGQVTLTFDDAYRQLASGEEMRLRAGLVLTLSQVPGVRTVVFHVGQDVLRDSLGEAVGAMTASQFLDNLIGENSYQYASLALYFANSGGDRIVREVRNIHYPAGAALENVVMEQLIKGPMAEGLRPILPENVTVLAIAVQDGTCTLNLSKEFLDVRGDETLLPEVTIYGIVDTLCDVLRVGRVQFQVEGQSNVIYKKKLSLDGPFHRNSEWIEAREQTEPSTEAPGPAAVGL